MLPARRRASPRPPPGNSRVNPFPRLGQDPCINAGRVTIVDKAHKEAVHLDCSDSSSCGLTVQTTPALSSNSFGLARCANHHARTDGKSHTLCSSENLRHFVRHVTIPGLSGSPCMCQWPESGLSRPCPINRAGSRPGPCSCHGKTNWDSLSKVYKLPCQASPTKGITDRITITDSHTASHSVSEYVNKH